MFQTPTVPLDTVLGDSAVVPPAFYPLHTQNAYPLSYNDALELELDSAVYLPQQARSDSNAAAVQLFTSVPEKTASAKPAENQTAAILIFCLYGLLVALNRMRSYRGSEGSGKKTGIGLLLPRFFVRRQDAGSPLFAVLLFFPLCLGFSLCIHLFSAQSGTSVSILFSILFCLSYMLMKIILRSLTAYLTDTFRLSIEFMLKKWIVYYNLLLLLVPFVFLYFIYPAIPAFHLFCPLMTFTCIYLIVNMVSIFLPKLKLHGIFLYFCTLEIVPVILIAVYFLRH